MSLLVAAVIVAIVAAVWVIYPLIVGRSGVISDAIPADLADREARRRVALAALRDVEYDNAAGKLDDADYQEMRNRLEIEALSAIRAADSAPSPEVESGTHVCGFVNPTGSRFCAGCGKALS